MKTKEEREVCKECKETIQHREGWSFCEMCTRGTAQPIGFIARRGKLDGLPVYRYRDLLKEYLQDMDIKDARAEVESDMKRKELIVIVREDEE